MTTIIVAVTSHQLCLLLIILPLPRQRHMDNRQS
jgi:hypothetical protein